jgi:hypothetical protein
MRIRTLEEGGSRSIAIIRHIVEIVAIVAAGAWAFYTFIYEERIKPAHEPLEAVETVSLVRDGRIRNMDVVRVKVGIRNVGKTEFDSIALSLKVFGYRYGREVRFTSDTAGSYAITDAAPLTAPKLILDRVELYAGAVHGKADVHNIIDPGADLGASYLIAVPRGRYDVLVAKFRYFPHKTPLQHRFVVNVTHLPDGSLDVNSPAPDLLQDNVQSELALAQ